MIDYPVNNVDSLYVANILVISNMIIYKMNISI